MTAMEIFKRKPKLELTQDQRNELRKSGLMAAANWGIIGSPALLFPGVVFGPFLAPEVAQAFSFGGIIAGGLGLSAIGSVILAERKASKRRRDKAEYMLRPMGRKSMRNDLKKQIF